MADPRFYRRAGPFTLAELSALSGAALAPGAKPDATFEDVAPLGVAGGRDVSFLDNKLYVNAFAQSNAGAALVHPDYADRAPGGMQLLLTPEPYRAYAKVASAFYPADLRDAEIDGNALVDDSAVIGKGCRIDAGAIVQANVEMGDGCWIGAGAVICEGVRLGNGVCVGPNAVLQYCHVGDACILHAGVKIGQDGFGFAMGPAGHLKVPQLGRVIIGADVEIGANTTIDRGTGPDTVIGDGTKIDNLVQIGHNVKTGRGCVIVSQVGISGSTELGDGVVLGGQVGLAGHLKIGSGAQLAAQSGIMRDVEPGAVMGGSPARPMRQWLRESAAVARLATTKGSKKEG